MPVFREPLCGMHSVRVVMARDVYIEKRAVTSGTLQTTSELEHPLQELVSTHEYPLSAVCIVSIIFGTLLATNMLCQLRVATAASGRGVLRCIRFHTWISLICIPTIGGNLTLMAGVFKYLPPLLCGILDVLTPFLWFNISFRGLSIALGR